MEFFGYLASIFMGLSLGMIGGGGSILTVPILVYLFKIEPVMATAYSLFIVGISALIGGINYLRRGEVDLKTGLIFATPSFIGVYSTRAFVMPNLPDPVFEGVSKALLIMLVFALLMLAASFSMIRSKPPKAQTRSLRGAARYIIIAAEGLVVGTVTGFVGAGGGFLIIPALVILIGLPMRMAVGTSLFIIAAKSLLGFLGDLRHHPEIDWTLLFTISAIAIAGIFVGMKMASRIPEKTLKKGFGYFVLIMGTMILLDQIRRI